MAPSRRRRHCLELAHPVCLVSLPLPLQEVMRHLNLPLGSARADSAAGVSSSLPRLSAHSVV